MKTAQLDKANKHQTGQRSKTRALKDPIYLDNHATTPLDPAVLATMLPYLSNNFGNPASTHFYGVKAQYAIDTARAQVCAAINAHANEVLFTSGATESNNFVIKGVFEHYRDQKPHIIVSNVEHKCILEAAKHTETLGAEVTVLKVNTEGMVEPAALKKALRPNTVLVSVMFANNEIGTINDIRELASICHEHGVLLHTDAAQAVGKLPIDVQALGVDMLSASGHKFYGPKGVGFLYASKSSQKFLRPLLDGGGQEALLRSGTLNVPGIVGLGKAIELTSVNMATQCEHYLRLRNKLYDRLRAAFPNLLLNGAAITPADTDSIAQPLKRLPHNLNITLPSIDSDALSRIYGVAFSSTSACSSGDVKPSYVLLAIGRSVDEAQASLRFGIGRFNTEAEIDAAADLLIEALT
jgi:cysteine desulfurase